MPLRPARLLQHLRRWAAPPASGPETDPVLLERFARSRDEDAFATLVARHGPMVLRLCRRVLADPQAAEDACQATFLVLGRRAETLRRPEALAGFLYGVAYRIALKARAASTRRQLRETPVPDPDRLDPHPDPLAEVSARELLRVVEEEVQRLPEVYRLPVVLCCLEGLSQEEAARRLGWTSGSVKGRLERGRARLHARLLRRGLTLSAALAAVAAARAAAAMPAALTTATLRTAVNFAAGQEASGSARMVLLAEEALRLPSLARMKRGLLLLAAGLLLVGTGALAQLPFASRPAANPGRANEEQRAGTSMDRAGDPLPPGVLQRLGSPHLRGASFLSAAFAPGGGMLAWPDDLGTATVHLWDVAAGRELRQLRWDGWAHATAFAPDGRLLATGGDRLRLWDPATGRQLFQSAEQPGGVWFLAFSPDGKLLAVSAGSPTEPAVQLWDVAERRELGRLPNTPMPPRTAAFSPDGRVLATGSDGRYIHLWDVAGRKELRTFTVAPPLGDPAAVANAINNTLRADNVYPLAFSPDGRTLLGRINRPSAKGGGALCTWDVDTGAEVVRIDGPATHAVLSPDGKLLAWAAWQADDTVHVCAAATGKELRRLAGRPFRAHALAFSADGQTLAAAGPGELRTWEVASGKELHAHHFEGHRDEVGQVAFSPDGKRLVSLGGEKAVRVWDAASGKELRQAVRTCWLWSAAIDADGRVLTLESEGRDLRLWDVARGEEYCRLGAGGSLIPAAISPDGKRLALGGNSVRPALDLWDPASGQEVRRLSEVPGVDLLTFSADGSTLAAAGGGGPVIRVWNTGTGKERQLIGAPATGRGRSSGFTRIALSADGKRLAAAAGGQQPAVRVWDLETGRALWQVPYPDVHGRGVSCLAFAPDGWTLAASQAGPIRLWEVATGRERHQLEGHRGAVNWVAYAPDGQTLASAGQDTTVLIWDMTGPRPTAVRRLSVEEWDALWQDLGAADAALAYRVLGVLTAAPREAVPFLERRVRALPSPAGRLPRVLADLGADDFAVRERASAELARLGEEAEPALRELLQHGSEPEARRRAEQLLEELGRPAIPSPSPETLRGLRAVEALERIGTPPAAEVLRGLTGGTPETRLSREAKASLQRLAKRR
jgi:RNA polymerase sigma factor (sigma-70 family)